MKIIPAIDLINGQCVRLSQGDYDRKTVYTKNPVDQAKLFADHGIKNLHLVDLDGAKSGSSENLKVLEAIANNTDLSIDFGGGIRSKSAVDSALSAGAKQLNIGSFAVKEVTKFVSLMEDYSAETFILSADFKDNFIAIHGWQEQSSWSLSDFIASYLKHNLRQVVCTDVSKDGMLNGPSTDTYENLIKEFSDLELIASGGVQSLEDLNKLKSIGCTGAIIGKAYYEGRINLKDLESYVS
jgi:phosphoribosylformimino-5-aminoimidazole carboxamide ribotide isomerase